MNFYTSTGYIGDYSNVYAFRIHRLLQIYGWFMLNVSTPPDDVNVKICILPYKCYGRGLILKMNGSGVVQETITVEPVENDFHQCDMVFRSTPSHVDAHGINCMYQIVE